MFGGFEVLHLHAPNNCGGAPEFDRSVEILMSSAPLCRLIRDSISNVSSGSEDNGGGNRSTTSLKQIETLVAGLLYYEMAKRKPGTLIL